MAIVSAAVFKTQQAAIATALTVQYKDSTATKVADSIANPKHPLRRALKLLIFNSSTGVFTSNDALIDLIYAGTGSSARGIQTDTMTAPVVEPSAGTAAVADATPTIITLTPPKALVGIDGVTVTVDAAAVPVRGYIGNNQIQLGVAIVAAQTVIVTFGTWNFADLSAVNFSGLAVTNNVA